MARRNARSDSAAPRWGCTACWTQDLGSCRVLPGSKFPSPKIPGFQFLARILAKPGGVLTPPYLPGGPGHSAGHALSWLLAALVPNFSDFYRIFRRFSRFFRHMFSIDFSHVFFIDFGIDLGSILDPFSIILAPFRHHFFELRFCIDF